VEVIPAPIPNGTPVWWLERKPPLRDKSFLHELKDDERYCQHANREIEFAVREPPNQTHADDDAEDHAGQKIFQVLRSHLPHNDKEKKRPRAEQREENADGKGRFFTLGAKGEHAERRGQHPQTAPNPAFEKPMNRTPIVAKITVVQSPIRAHPIPRAKLAGS